VQALQDDGGAILELREHALHVRRAGEGRRSPGDVRRVGRDIEPRARLGETEAGVPEPAGGEKPLDVRDGQEVVEATLLGPRDDERLLLPVAVEELLGGDGVERTS
jgi:hypothetical protein